MRRWEEDRGRMKSVRILEEGLYNEDFRDLLID